MIRKYVRPPLFDRMLTEGFAVQVQPGEKTAPEAGTMMNHLSKVPVVLMPPFQTQKVKDLETVEFSTFMPIFDEYFCEADANIDGAKGNLVGLYIRSTKLADGKRRCDCTGFHSKDGKRVEARQFGAVFAVNADGGVDPAGVTAQAPHKPGYLQGSRHEGLAYRSYLGVTVYQVATVQHTAEEEERFDNSADAFAICVLLLLQSHEYLFAKNISLKSHDFNEGLKPRHVRQRRNRFGAGTRYHTLVIRGLGRYSGRTMSLADALSHLPLHKRRRCWRHYGPAAVHRHPDGRDRGLLFGERAGKYLSPPCMPGSAEWGEIDKTYVVEPAV